MNQRRHNAILFERTVVNTDLHRTTFADLSTVALALHGWYVVNIRENGLLFRNHSVGSPIIRNDFAQIREICEPL